MGLIISMERLDKLLDKAARLRIHFDFLSLLDFKSFKRFDLDPEDDLKNGIILRYHRT